MVRARLLLLACLACFAWGCAEAQHPGDESSSSEDVPRHTKHRSKKKKKVAHKHEDDDEDAPKKKKLSDDDEDAPKKKVVKKSSDDDEDAPKKPVKKVAAKKSSDDDDEDAPKKRPVKKVAPKKSDDDDEDAPKKPVKKVAAKKASHDDDDEDAPKKPVKKVAAKKVSHDDDDDDDAPKKPPPKLVAKTNPHSEHVDEDEDAPKKPVKKIAAKQSSDDEDEAAPKKPAPKVAAKKAVDDEETLKISDDDEEDKPKPKPVAVKAKPKARSEDEEDKPKVVAKAKAKADDDEAPAKKPAVEDKPAPEEPPKKQRSIEEDIAIDDPLAAKPPPREVASADEPTEDAGETTAVTAAVVVPVGPTLTNRALTTPAGQLDLHGGLPIDVLTLTDAMGVSTSSTATGLALGVAYGINAKAELGLDYTLGVSPGKLQGPATVHGAYSFATGKLDFAAAAALGIDFYDTVDSTTMATSSKTAASLQLGAWVRYHATPTISIFSGLPGTPNASASLSKLAFALPVIGYQIQVGLSDRGTTAVTLPIGLGYQASPKLYTFASLTLANIRIANTANAFLFKDYIPLALGGFYNFDTFSLGASFADDLKQGFGYLRFELIARYLLH